jgi:hypothetical protein
MQPRYTIETGYGRLSTGQGETEKTERKYLYSLHNFAAPNKDEGNLNVDQQTFPP